MDRAQVMPVTASGPGKLARRVCSLVAPLFFDLWPGSYPSPAMVARRLSSSLWAAAPVSRPAPGHARVFRLDLGRGVCLARFFRGGFRDAI